MAEPLFIARDAAGAVVFDSREALAGICVGVVQVPAATVVTKTYPDYDGHTAIVMSIEGVKVWDVAIDYALGYPRVTFGANVLRTAVIFIL